MIFDREQHGHTSPNGKIASVNKLLSRVGKVKSTGLVKSMREVGQTVSTLSIYL